MYGSTQKCDASAKKHSYPENCKTTSWTGNFIEIVIYTLSDLEDLDRQWKLKLLLTLLCGTCMIKC